MKKKIVIGSCLAFIALAYFAGTFLVLKMTHSGADEQSIAIVRSALTAVVGFSLLVISRVTDGKAKKAMKVIGLVLVIAAVVCASLYILPYGG